VNELGEGLMAVAALLVCIIPHEVAHGYVAWRLGDPTAKLSGRLSLNPIRHLDPIGSVLLPVALLLLRRFAGFPIVFGWAKPVPINPNYFRNPWRGMLWVGLAGPATNVLMALIVAGTGRALIALGLTARWLLYFLGLIVLLSLVLCAWSKWGSSSWWCSSSSGRWSSCSRGRIPFGCSWWGPAGSSSPG